MIKNLQNTSLANLILLLVLNILCKVLYLVHGLKYKVKLSFFDPIAVKSLSNLTYQTNLWWWLLGIVMHYMLALYINQKCMLHNLCGRNNITPAFSYVICSSLLPQFVWPSLSLILVVPLLEIISQIFKKEKKSSMTSLFLYMGILFGFVTLLRPIDLIYTPFIILICTIQQTMKKGDIWLFILGFITVWAWRLGIDWLADGKIVVHFKLAFVDKFQIKTLLALIGLVLGSVLGYRLYLSQRILTTYTAKKKWTMLSTLVLPSIILGLSVNNLPNNLWTDWVVICSMFISGLFNIELNSRYANFTLIVSIIVLVFQQFLLLM